MTEFSFSKDVILVFSCRSRINPLPVTGWCHLLDYTCSQMIGHIEMNVSVTIFVITLFQPESSEVQKKLHKAMSSGDLGKVDSMRKNSQDGRFVVTLMSHFTLIEL